MKINIDDEIEINDEEENIYQKLARATARAVDIELGKTTLADLLDGYTKSRILQQKIDKAIDYIVKNCILSDEWTDLDFCNFIPTGKITYKQLTSKKVKNLLEILGDKE